MLWLIVIFPVVLLIYLLTAPIYFEVNSVIGMLRIRFHHLVLATVLMGDGLLIVQVNILWWKKQVDILNTLFQKKGEKEAQPIEKKIRQNKSHTFPFKKMVAMLKSFKVNQCTVALDTGDVSVNATLFPMFHWLSRKVEKTIAINFYHKNEVVLEIENNIARIIWAFITH